MARIRVCAALICTTLLIFFSLNILATNNDQSPQSDKSSELLDGYDHNSRASRIFSIGGTRTHGATLRTLAWHPNGKYLLAAGDASSLDTTSLRLYKVNSATETLTDVQAFAGTPSLNNIYSMAWSSDGSNVAVGNNLGNVFIYRFSELTNGYLTPIASITLSNPIQAITWYQTGTILAVGEGTNVYIYQVEESNESSTLIQKAIFNNTNTVTSLSWSTDSKYLAIAGSNIARITNLSYNSGTWSLSLISSYDHKYPITQVTWHTHTNILNVVGTYVSFLFANAGSLDFICEEGSNNLNAQSLSWNSTGDQFVIVGTPQSRTGLYFFDHKKMLISRSNLFQDTDGNAQMAAFSPLTNLFAIASSVGASTGYSLKVFSTQTITSNFSHIFNSSIGADHGDVTTSLAWHPRGTVFAAGGQPNSNINGVESTIRLFEFNNSLATLSEIKNARTDHGAETLSIKWSPRGKFLAIGGYNFNNITVRVFEYDEVQQTLTNLPGCEFYHGGQWIYCVDWSPDGNFLAISGDKANNISHRVLQFDETTKTLTDLAGTQSNHGDEVDALHWNPSGKYLATGGFKYTAVTTRIYKFDSTAKTLTALSGATANHGSSVKSVAWSPDGVFLVTGGLRYSNITSRLYSFNLNTETLTEETTGQKDHGNDVTSVFWTHDGRNLAIGGLRNNAISATYATHRIYSFNPSNKTFTELTNQIRDHGDNINAVAISHNLSFLIAGGNRLANVPIVSIRLHPLDLTQQRTIEQPGGRMDHGANVNSCHWSPDGNFLAIGGTRVNNIGIRIYQYDQLGGKLTLLPFTCLDFGGNVNSVKWSPDGNFLAVGGARNNTIDSQYTSTRIYQFDALNGILIFLPYCRVDHGADIKALAWTPNGFNLATGGVAANNITHRIYSFDEAGKSLQEQITTQSNHGATVYALEWTSDNRFLALGGALASTITTRVYEYNASTKIIDVASSATANHGNTVYSVAWTSNDSHLLTGGAASGSNSARIYAFDKSLETLTLAGSQIFGTGSQVNSVDWNPDDSTFVLGANRLLSSTHRIYIFDRRLKTIKEIPSSATDFGDNVLATAWHQNRSDLCACGIRNGSITTRIYSYTPASVYPISTSHQNHSYAASWHPNYNLIAFAGALAGNVSHRIYQFNETNSTLIEQANAANGALVYGAQWNPLPSLYLATSGQKTATPSSHRMYKFFPSAQQLGLSNTQDHGGIVRSVSWTPDGQYLAIAGNMVNNITTRVYHFNEAAGILTLADTANHGNAVYSVSWHPSGQYLSAGGLQIGGVSLRTYYFNQATKKLTELNVLQRDHGTYIFSVAWSNSGRYLAIGGGRVNSITTRVYEFNQQDGTLTEMPGCQADHGTNYIYILTWHPSDKELLVGGARTAVIDNEFASIRAYMFDNINKTLTERKDQRIDTGATVQGLSYRADGNYFAASTALSNNVSNYIFKTKDNSFSVNFKETLETPTLYSYIKKFLWSPCSKTLCASIGDKVTQLFSIDVNAQKKPLNLQSYAMHDATINNLSWHPDGKFIAIAGSRGPAAKTVRVYFINNNNALIEKTYADHGTDILDVAWNPDGNYLAVTGKVSNNITTRIYAFYYDGLYWNLDNLPNCQVNHTQTCYAVAWNSDGSYLATAGALASNITTRLYAFNSSTNTLTLKSTANHSDTVYDLAWHPSLNYLASGGNRTNSITTRIYSVDVDNDVLTELVASRADHGNTVNFVIWHPYRPVLTMGGTPGTAGSEVSEFSFDPDTGSLTPTGDKKNLGAASCASWRLDGAYLAIAIPTGVNGTILYPRVTHIRRSYDEPSLDQQE